MCTTRHPKSGRSGCLDSRGLYKTQEDPSPSGGAQWRQTWVLIKPKWRSYALHPNGQYILTGLPIFWWIELSSSSYDMIGIIVAPTEHIYSLRELQIFLAFTVNCLLLPASLSWKLGRVRTPIRGVITGKTTRNILIRSFPIWTWMLLVGTCNMSAGTLWSQKPLPVDTAPWLWPSLAIACSVVWFSWWTW